MPERFRRCWDSIIQQKVLQQKPPHQESHHQPSTHKPSTHKLSTYKLSTYKEGHDWGAIIFDDASDPWIAEEINRIIAPHAAQVSFIARRRRAGLLSNTVHAIRHLCASPDQVIITLDADDHLIGCQVLNRLAEEYDRGADLTVGSMLRTDKRASYPVRLDMPRCHRGGNVWQHLRSFRKRLFDALPDAKLQIDGSFVELASDWAFMLPMVEAAQKPVWIKEPLYMHEPGEDRNPARAKTREQVIAQLIERYRGGLPDEQ